MLRVVSARLLVLLVAIPLMDCECSGSSGCADEDYDTPRTVTPKFRVEILDSLDAPVADVAVRIEYFKKYCDGTQSEHVVKEGVTGLEGIYSTELMERPERWLERTSRTHCVRIAYRSHDGSLLSLAVCVWDEWLV